MIRSIAFTLILIVGINFQSFGQTVTGTVTDAQTGDSLIGVNILVKGTTTGTVTDGNGHYSLTVPSLRDTLRFSYIGYQTKTVTINGRTTINIQLKPTIVSGQQMVVVGYGTQSKQNLTESVTSIDGSKLAKSSHASIIKSLQGRVAGLNIRSSTGDPTSDPRINIRGFTSINGGSPLVLIDGVKGELTSVNPNNVKSVSVLKGASATAIYGGAAAYGVILVETKDPQSGPIQVSIGSHISMLTPVVRTDFFNNGYKQMKQSNIAYRNVLGISVSGYPKEMMEKLKARQEDPSLPAVVVEKRRGQKYYVQYGNQNIWPLLYRKWRPMQEYNISLSGGSDRIRGGLSGQYYNKAGIVKPHSKNKFQKYKLRGKLNFDINNWITVFDNLYASNEHDFKYGGARHGWNSPYNYRVTWHGAPYFVQGKVSNYIQGAPSGAFLRINPFNDRPSAANGTAPAILYGKAHKITNSLIINNTIGAKIDLYPSLSVNLKYTIRYLNGRSSVRSTEIPYSYRPGKVSFFSNDKLTEQRKYLHRPSLNVFAKYNHSFNKHQIKALIGLRKVSYKTNVTSASIKDLITKDVSSLNLGSGNRTVGASGYNWKLLNYFFRLHYNYGGRYLFEVNGSYSGSSRFPADSRWGFFPSFSTGWIISNEPFFRVSKNIVSNLKLRISYGQMGNQHIDPYTYIPILKKRKLAYLVNGQRLQSVTEPSLRPGNITWEKVNTADIGLDVSFLNNSLSAALDLYQRNTMGMLTKGQVLPAVLGAPPPTVNAADMRTRGFEFSISYSNTFQVGGKPFHFDLRGSVSNSTSKITDYSNPNKSLSDYYVGQTIGEIWGYHSNGLFSSDEEAANHADQGFINRRRLSAPGNFSKLSAGDIRFLDLNGDGKINDGTNTVKNPGDRTIIGNASPQFPYSFGVTANWNNIDFSVYFQGIGKQSWFPSGDGTLYWGYYSRPYPTFIRKDMIGKIWSPDNTDAFFPKLRSYVASGAINRELSVPSDRYLENIAYLRMKNLTIGYTLPQKLVPAVENIRIYVSGQNLFTISPLTDYLNPANVSNAISLNNASATYHYSNNAARLFHYPVSKIYTFGVDIKF